MSSIDPQTYLASIPAYHQGLKISYTHVLDRQPRSVLSSACVLYILNKKSPSTKHNLLAKIIKISLRPLSYFLGLSVLFRFLVGSILAMKI